MKYKTLFRLMLKVTGAWLCLHPAGQLVMYLIYVPYYLSNPGSLRPWSSYTLQLIYPLVQIGAGLYLFFLGGKWVADLAIPGNRNYCHECGYDLTGSVGHVCVECGTPFKPVEDGLVQE